MRVADTIALMELGTIAWSGPTEHADMDRFGAAYLGAAASTSARSGPPA